MKVGDKITRYELAKKGWTQVGDFGLNCEIFIKEEDNVFTRIIWERTTSTVKFVYH